MPTSASDSVPSDVPWSHLTEEQRATIRMWKALGLPVQATVPGGEWYTAGKKKCEHYQKDADYVYRLRPK